MAGDPILELGCGTGRVLLSMAKVGHHCVGLDNDPAMLAYLQQGVGSITPTPLLVVEDMCRFNLHRQFSLVILPCNTFSTLSEAQQLSCLACVYEHLKPGGFFAFSIPNSQVLLSLPARAGVEYEEAFTHPQTGNPVQVSSSYHRTKKLFRLTWYYDELHPDGRVDRFTALAAHYLLPTQAYLDKLRQVGLVVNAQYGDFDRSEFVDESPCLICIASR